MRRRSFHRILEHAPDLARPTVLRQKSDILTIQENLSLIQPVIAADRIKKRRFSRSIGTDDRHELPLIQMQVQSVQSVVLARRTSGKYFGCLFYI